MAAGRFSRRFSRRHLLAGLVSAGLLSGCGFKLRGMDGVQANYKTVYLRFDASVPFELQQALRQNLTRAGVQMVEVIADAELMIELGAFGRQISRTSRSETGQTTAELIRFSQQVQAYRLDNEAQIMDTEQVVMRDRQLDPNQRMAAERELQSITQAMLQNLSRQIIDGVNRAYVAEALAR